MGPLESGSASFYAEADLGLFLCSCCDQTAALGREAGFSATWITSGIARHLASSVPERRTILGKP
jgi:hypothetical protein